MELVLGTTAFLVLLMATCLYLLRSTKHTPQLPDTLPWVGCRDEVFSRTRACIRELTNGDRTRIDGYTKYSRKGQPFIIPDPGLKPQVMLPPDHVQWMLQLPDTVLGRQADNEKLGFRHMTNLMTKPDPVITETIRKDLTRNILKQHSDISDEIRRSIDATMGTEDSWVEINLIEAVETIVIRSHSRPLVGLPLCRSEKYVSAMRAMTSSWAKGSLALRYVPWFLRPLLGLLMSLPYKLYKTRALKIVLPMIIESMSNIEREIMDPAFSSESPDNFIKWMVTAALKAKSTAFTTPEDAAERFLIVVLALDSTSVALANMLLDLLSSKPELRYYEALRQESEMAFQAEKDWDDWASVNKLRLTDSAIRETLRLNPQAVRSRQREVLQKDGLKLPDGQHLPKGSWIGFSPTDIHFDERFYPDPETYDPFRFVAGNETLELEQRSISADVASKERMSSLMVATNKTFLSFGHGRHA
ncbi:CypX, Cytochrome P450, partial [Pyrenophora tritici-repentis]